MEKSSNKNILFSHESRKLFVSEQITSEHTLSFVVAGILDLQLNTRKMVIQPGQIFIVRKNELTKAIKRPENSQRPFKCINLMLSQDMLRNFAVQNNVAKQEQYIGSPILDLSKNNFIRGYFDSLVPYFNEQEKMTARLAYLKSQEVIELLLSEGRNLEHFLFDMSVPHKIDLKHFMNNNYLFNIPLSEFARLTGRSISTFQRDFRTLFKSTPEKWLREKRLEEANYLIIEKKQKPSEVYHHVGFENFSHFSLIFKQKFGYNASDVKKGNK